MKQNKKLPLMFIAIFVCTSGKAQSLGATTKGISENNNRIASFIHNISTKDNIINDTGHLNLDDVDGSMYYEDDFKMGSIYYEGKFFAKALMKYNAFTDQVEIKRYDEHDIGGVLKDTKISCQIDEEHYLYMDYLDKRGDLNKGYLILKWKGTNYRLYLKKSKLFKAGQVQKTSLHLPTPDRFIDWDFYCVAREETKPVFIGSSKKNVTSLFAPEIRDQIKDYIKDNRLDFRQQRDLRKLLAFVDSIH